MNLPEVVIFTRRFITKVNLKSVLFIAIRLANTLMTRLHD